MFYADLMNEIDNIVVKRGHHYHFDTIREFKLMMCKLLINNIPYKVTGEKSIFVK